MKRNRRSSQIRNRKQLASSFKLNHPGIVLDPSILAIPDNACGAIDS